MTNRFRNACTISGILAVAGLAVASPPRPTTVPAKPDSQPTQPARPADPTKKPATPAQPERDWSQRQGHDRASGLAGDQLRQLDQLEGIWNLKIERFGSADAKDAAATPGAPRATADKPQTMEGVSKREWVLGQKFLQERVALTGAGMGEAGGVEQRREGVRDGVTDPVKDHDKPAAKRPGEPAAPDRQPGDLAKPADKPISPTTDREVSRTGRNERVLGHDAAKQGAMRGMPGIMYFGFDKELNKYVVNFLNGMDGSVILHYGTFDSATRTLTFSTNDPANANISTPAAKDGKDYRVTIRVVSDSEHIVEMHELSDSGTPITDPARPAERRDSGSLTRDEAGTLVYRVTYTKASEVQREGFNERVFEDDAWPAEDRRDLHRDLEKDDLLDKPYDQRDDLKDKDTTKKDSMKKDTTKDGDGMDQTYPRQPSDTDKR